MNQLKPLPINCISLYIDQIPPKNADYPKPKLYQLSSLQSCSHTMIKTLPKGRYPALEQLQQEVPYQPPVAQSHLDHKIQRIKRSSFYLKDDIFAKCINYLIPHQPPNFIVDKIIEKYFTFSINPIYEKIAGLPQEIFVCGFCKEPYYGASEYLLHCIVLGCPANHNRSTHFFYFKSKFTQIKNSDVQETLTQDQWNQFKNISFRKRRFFLTKFDIKPLHPDSSKFLSCGKCNIKSKYNHGCLATNYIPHWALYCKSPNLTTNSHSITPIQRSQDLLTFVDDVIHFAINYNVITLFNDSYITILKNPKFVNKSTDTHFCANCKSHFRNQAYFLHHCLFQCKDKLNPKSSHILKRKKANQPEQFSDDFNYNKNQKIQPKKKAKPLEVIKEKLEIQSKEKNDTKSKEKNEIKSQSSEIKEKPWNVQFNSKFKEFKEFFSNNYFCGQCYSHFQDDESYVVHCLFSLCPLNQPRNSHFFSEKHSEEILSIKTVKIYVAEMDKKTLQNIKEDYQLEGRWKEIVNVVDSSTKEILKLGKHDSYFCGQCGQQFKRQQKFAMHCINDCFSATHEKNSHFIEYKKTKEIPDDEFRRFLISYLYAVQIIKFSPNKRYKLTPNVYINVDPNYLCGKCDTIFGNIYEYVLHSLEVCLNLKHRNSSHFIGTTVIKNESQKLKWALDVVACDGMMQNSWGWANSSGLLQENEQKIGNSQPMEIEQNQSNALTQKKETSQAKIGFIHQKVQEVNCSEDITEDKQNVNYSRVLRPNIDYQADKKEYYCGLCEIFFKNELKLIDHLEECRSFQNKKSSHFYVTNKRHMHMNIHRILSKSDQKPYPKPIAGIEFFIDENFKCGCGEEGPLKKLAQHNRDKHFTQVVKGSSHIVLSLAFPCLQPKFIFLPVNPKMVNPEIEMVCPCNPWKKYKYLEFVNHIIKRHQGKSPKFWMRFDGEN